MCLQYIQIHANRISTKGVYNGKNNDTQKKETTSTSTRNDNDSEGDIKTTLANNRFAKKKMCTYTESSETKGERNRTKQMKKKKNASEQMHSKS